VVASSSARPRDFADTDARIRSAFERSFRAGETIFDEGHAGDALWVIQAGQVELRRRRAGGTRVIARHGPGDFFGEMAVLLGRPQAVHAVAIRETRLVEVDARTFEGMCVERPEIAIRVIQRLAARMIQLEQRLASLGGDDVLRPVLRVLLRHAESDGNGARVETTLRALAEEAGVSLGDAHRALAQLMDRRSLRLTEDGLAIPDLEALAAALDGD
jgi:CRP-like cAMP-binding protein